MNRDTLAINAIRVLSAEAIDKSKSGHPGLPLGCAPVAYELYAHHMKFNPLNPDFANRDRFVLSAGHGSMLMYSLLHLFGFGLTKEDLMNFRQAGSLTPGHPEYRHTKGVETTTGPLGQGVANAVGMAIAESHLAAIYNREGYPVVDHYTYALCGDGCMMEGIESEAASLAGTLKLGKLIVLYDDNGISIEGDTDTAFTEDGDGWGQPLHIRFPGKFNKGSFDIISAGSDGKFGTNEKSWDENGGEPPVQMVPGGGKAGYRDPDGDLICDDIANFF